MLPVVWALCQGDTSHRLAVPPPCAPRDRQGPQHGSILGTSTPSHSAATRGRDILTDATPLQMSPNPPYGAAGYPLSPPAPPPPWGPPPADLKGCRPSTQDANTTLPALCNGAAPQPSKQRPAQTGSSLPPSNASSRHRRPGDTTGSSVPSPGTDLPSCAALCRSGRKTSPNHWWGKMNVLASFQARVMGKRLISTICPHSRPPGPLEASPTSISPPATWLRASKSLPSSLSPGEFLWHPLTQ